MRYLKHAVSVAAVVLLLGAGCAAKQADQPATSAGANSPDNAPSMVKDAEGQMNQNRGNENARIRLQAEAKGNGEVAFDWDLDESVEKTDKYRLIRSEDMDPEFNGKNYWLQVHHTNSDYSWIGLPTGTMNFRICTFDKAKNACDVYSNNVMVEVK